MADNDLGFIRTLLDAIPVGIIVADAEGQFLVWNDAASRLVGLGPANMDQEEWSQHYGLYELDGSALLASDKVPLARALAGEVVIDQHLRLGTAKVICCNARPLPSGAAVVVFHDVTTRTRQSQRLQRLNSEMETFTQVVSHDLREPLRAVSSFLQLLEDRNSGKLDEQSQLFVNYAKDGANRMAGLLQDLSATTLLKAGPPKLVDCEELLLEVLSGLSAVVSETGAVISNDSLPTLEGWRSPLGQLFQNLIANALKFQKGGTPRVHIGAREQGEEWVFLVEDNGIGIPAEKIDRIFDAFHRLHPRKQYEGSGLGLSICQKAVGLHGGTIWAESELGEGSIFTFSLPKKQEAELPVEDVVERLGSENQKLKKELLKATRLNSELNFESILDAIEDLVLVKGPRSKLLWANTAFRKLYGMSNVELRGLIDAEHSDPDDTIAYVRDDRQVFSTGRALRVREAVTDSNGQLHWYDTVKAPIFDPDGKVVQSVGTSRPVEDSELIGASAQTRSLQKSRFEDLRILVEGIPVAVAMLDASTRFLTHSRAWSALFGIEEDTLLGESYAGVLESKLALISDIDLAMESGKAVDKSGVSLNLEHGSFQVNVQVRPWSFEEGRVGGVIVVLDDVTALVESAAELGRKNEELVKFSYLLSHDVMAPVKTLSGLHNILREELVEGRTELALSVLERMENSIDGLTRLIRGIEEFTWPELQERSGEPVVLQNMVNQALMTLADEVAKLKAKVVVSVPEGVQVLADPRRLRQVIQNLLSNALKFHPADGPPPAVEVKAKVDAKNVVIQVSDNGVGVDSAMKDSVYDMFFRGSADHPGAGLGLYIVKSHLAQMGGQIRHYQEMDRTVFEAQLPAAGL